MRIDLKTSLSKLGKKRVNVFDIIKLYKLFRNISIEDIESAKQFLNNYYGINDFPDEFYVLFNNCAHSDNYKDLFYVLLDRNIYDLITLLKGDADSLDDIQELVSPIEYYKIPNKQIRIIIELLSLLDLNKDTPVKEAIKDNIQWKLRRQSVNSLEEYHRIAIKMYMSIGFDNSIDILNGKYGLVDYEMIHYLFSNFNVKDKNDREKTAFNEFLFNNKKEPDNNMRLMLEGKSNELFINFDYFFNYIEHYIEKIGCKLNRTKVNLLLKERYLAPRLESPEISGDILEDMISSYHNKYGIDETESEIISKNLKVYNSKLKTKTKSSIIKTDIPSNGDYSFEILPLADVRNLVMGYRAGNCFRINGDAFILFNNFLTNPHMRLLSISTPEYKDFGMVLLMRNGNILIAQGIEISKRVPDNLGGEKLYSAVKDAIIYIMNQMNNDKDEIVASIIGLSNSNTAPYNHNILPFIVNPIFDYNQQVYNGVANYQGLLALKEGKTINDMRSFVPKIEYYDNPDVIYRRDGNASGNYYQYREVEKILISLRYARFKRQPQIELIRYFEDLASKKELYTICTLNWYITVFEDGSIDSFVNHGNPEVVEEYNSELAKMKQLK